jgi:hypothetical protein
MADFEVARSVLRGLGRDLKEVEDGRFSFEVRGQTFLVESKDVDHYLSVKSQIKRQTETQIWLPGFYEHVVQFEGRRPYRRNEENFSLKSEDGKAEIEIGRPSTLFCLALADVDRLDRELIRATSAGPLLRWQNSEPRSISDLFRLNSIKVSTSSEAAFGKSISRMHELAEAGLFHFAYGQGIAFSFTKTWERTYYWVGRKANETVQFPRLKYNTELVSYYNLALASDSLILGFLALYKIMEFFYTSVSENALHQKVKEHLVAPDFSHSKPKKLRDLIKAIRQFESRLDELSALKLVLTKYFEREQLRSWIEDYEAKNGDYFTTEITLFGQKTRIDTSDNTIISNLASRIYMIRNALVHNKEGELSRFIPYTGQEEALNKEVQILLYLAEQMIIKTGEDLNL